MSTHLSPDSLAALACVLRYGPVSIPDATKTLAAEDGTGVRRCIEALSRQGYIETGEAAQGQPTTYVIARKGRNYLAAREPAAPRSVAQPRLPFSSSSYDGAELRPFANRPGAMDAFKLPSMMNGFPVPPKGALA